MMEAIFPLVLEGIGFAPGGAALLEGISLSVERGSRIVLLGANGAGKSVLMRVMHGLLEPTSGRLRWAGSVERPRSQALVLQRPVLLRRSALGNVVYGLKLAGVERRECERRARAALSRVGLAHLAGHPARVLSGGEQQGVALARAWALEPQILFLDEPTANLDPNAARVIEQIISDIHAAGTSIVMTTQNIGQARRLADQIVFLHRGRIAELTEAAAFFQTPRSAEAEAFLREELP